RLLDGRGPGANPTVLSSRAERGIPLFVPEPKGIPRRCPPRDDQGVGRPHHRTEGARASATTGERGSSTVGGRAPTRLPCHPERSEGSLSSSRSRQGSLVAALLGMT